MRQRTVTAVAVVGSVLVFLGPGIWSFFWPESFHRTIATYDPFNLHLFHDLGAFQLGIGAGLLTVVVWRDALAATLFGAVVGNGFHTVSHFLDRDLGGRASDPWTLGVVTIVFAAALVMRLRWISANRRGEV